jgi:hypothetical protein
MVENAEKRIERLREEIRWELVGDDDLRFAYHLLNPHAAVFGDILDEIVKEISFRYSNHGFSLTNDEPVKVIVKDVPEFMYKWPFKLFWKQRRNVR